MARTNGSIEIGDRVSVVWEETGCSFLATVVGEYEPDEHFGNTRRFDIVYDEEVNHKRVTERHVDISRLSRDVCREDLLEDEYNDMEYQSTCGGKYLFATSGKDLLAKLISIKEDEDDLDILSDMGDFPGDDDEDEGISAAAEPGDELPPVEEQKESESSMDSSSPDSALKSVDVAPAGHSKIRIKLELSPQQVVMINEALYVEQIHALISGSKRTFHFIVEQLLAFIEDTSDFAPEFEPLYHNWLENTGSDETDTVLWLAPGQDGGKLLTHCKAILAATAALCRILSCYSPGLDVTPIDEAIVDTALRWVASLVSTNCTKSLSAPIVSKSASASARSKQDLSSKGAASSRKNARQQRMAQNGVRQVFQVVGAGLLPLVKAVLDTLDILMSARRQPERLCVASYELSLNCLRAEPASSTRASMVASANAYPLQAMHASAINHLQTMSSRYPSHRSTILSESLLLLSATHDVRQTGLTFPVHFSVHSNKKVGNGGVSGVPKSASADGRYISTSFAALLLLIQSAAGAENANSLLGDAQKMCKTVISDLLHRSQHKEMGSEYRTLTTALLVEIEIALSSPLMPVCAMLVDSLLSKILADLFAISGSATGGAPSSSTNVGAPSTSSDHKSKQSYTMFLMDLVGVIGKVLCNSVLQKNNVASSSGHKSESSADPVEQSRNLDVEAPRITRALRSKFRKMETELVNRRIREESSRNALEQSGVAIKIEKSEDDTRAEPLTPMKDGHGNGVVANPNAVEAESESSSANSSGDDASIFGIGCFDVEQTLDILGEVTTITLDAIAEYDLVGAERDEGADMTRDDFGSDPLFILRQLGFTKILSMLAPSVKSVDAQRHLICEYMRSITMNTGADGTAYSMILSLWHKDCIDTGRENVACYVEGCLRGLPKLMELNQARITRNSVRPSVVSGPGADSVTITKTADLSNSDPDDKETSIMQTSGDKSVLVESKLVWETRISFEWVQQAYHSLLAEWFATRQYESIIALLLNLLASEHSSMLRARAVRTIHALYSVDPQLISRKPVCVAITQRLNDVSISVREETVKLIGSYIMQTTASNIKEPSTAGLEGRSAADYYIDGLLVRLRDRGVSVRRAVVHLVRNLLLRHLNHSRYAELCLALLERSALPKEEESIRDVIRATFHELWLTPPKDRSISYESVRIKTESTESVADKVFSNVYGSKSRSITVLDIGANETMGTPADGTMNSIDTHATEITTVTPEEAHAELICLQIIDVLSSSTASTQYRQGTRDGLIDLIREVLHGTKGGDEESATTLKRRECTSAYCVVLLRALMEIVMKLEEKNETLLKRIQKQRPREDQLVSAIGTIAVFCSAHPPLLVPHMSALLPYLKPHPALNTQQHSDITLTVCKILSAVTIIPDVPLTITQTMSFRELNFDLQQIVLSGGYNNVNAAVHCLAAIAAHVTADAIPYMQLAHKCFVAIRSIARSINDTLCSGVQGDGGGDDLTKAASGWTSGTKSSKIDITLSAQQTALVQRCLIILGALSEHSPVCTSELAALASRQKPNRDVSGSPTSVAQAMDDSDTMTYVSKTPRRDGSSNSLRGVGSLSCLEAADSSEPSHLERRAKEGTVAKESIDKIAAITPDTINGCTYAASVFALTLSDELCEVRAVQALCSVYIGCPTLINLSDKLLGRLLNCHTSSPSVHEKLLAGLNHIMQAEEQRVERGQAAENMRAAGLAVDDVSLRSSSDRDSDVTVTAAAVIGQMKDITAFLYSDILELRQRAMTLVATLLRQGMLCPLDVIAHLVATQGDPVEEQRLLALRLLQQQDEKYGQFVDNRLLEGLEAAHEMQICTIGEAQPLRCIEVRGEDGNVKEIVNASVFAPIYKSLIQSGKNKGRKRDVIVGALKRISATMQQQQQCRMDFARALEARRTSISVSEGAVAISSGTPMTALAANANQMDITGDHQSAVPAKVEPPASPHSHNSIGSPQAILRRMKHLHDIAIYLTTTLAYLPYESVAEPLLIIQWLTRQGSVDSSILCADLSKSACTIGAAQKMEKSHSGAPSAKPEASAPVSKENQENQPRMSRQSILTNLEASLEGQLIVDTDILQQWVAGSPLFQRKVCNQLHSAEVDALCQTEEKLAGTDAQMLSAVLTGGFESRCREALIRLKAFLKQTYNLSKERCQQYIALGSNNVDALPRGHARDIVSTIDDENSGAKKLSQAFLHIPTSVAAVAGGSDILELCISNPTKDSLFTAITACVSDINRLKCLCDADEDLGTSNSDGVKTKAVKAIRTKSTPAGKESKRKEKRAPAKQPRGTKRRRPRSLDESQGATAGEDSDVEVASESELSVSEEEDDDYEEEMVVQPRRSSSGRALKPVNRLGAREKRSKF